MFTVIDGVLIALTLLCVFLGIKRGIVGSLIKLFGGVIRLFLSIVLAKPLVKVISLTQINERMFDKYKLWASNISDKFNVNLVGMDSETLDVFVGDALSDANIPKIFRGLFKKAFAISPEVISGYESITLADFMGITITNIILTVSAFIFIFVSLWLIFFILKRWSKRHSSSTTFFAKTNKWLGCLFGVLQACCILSLFYFVVLIIENMGIFKGVVDYVSGSTVNGFLYKVFKQIFNNSFDLNILLHEWLN